MIPALDLYGDPVRKTSRDTRVTFAVAHFLGTSWLMARSERRRRMDRRFPNERLRHEWVFDRSTPVLELSAYPFHESADGKDCVECSTVWEAAEDLAALEAPA